MKKSNKWILSTLAAGAVFALGACTGLSVGGQLGRTAEQSRTAVGQTHVLSATTTSSSTFSVALGEPSAHVKAKLGNPKYGYNGINKTFWWIYDSYWIGFRNGRVVELFTNHKNATYNGVKIGYTRGQVEKKVKYAAKPQWSLFNVGFTFSNLSRDRILYKIGNEALIAYYDTLDKNKLMGIRVVKPEELVYKKYFGYTYRYIKKPAITSYSTDWPSVNRNEAEEILLLSNTERLKKGISPLSWSKQAAASASYHSKDMFTRHYFAHTLPDGRTPFDLMRKQGISFHEAGENIATGYVDAIDAVFGWMNSAGHRKSLLNANFSRLGAGVYETYYTQHFYRP
ncbi:CAP domain-containing protein [Aneurinibacillus sp. Ricciae_BoGa-3]|uniref:CAP domain-containing protein n=1 Tax=Aneurinibacillus sp. Ricciae_BoGa-3 TaxID=3022697 RepID=UPI002340EDD9|nr:CAP domain-containing protein [Aneurinibacillus sp. Ricciae_BoGa-3]WCK55339.1 CAP domain-containing protein [Aneurinibacillus sp. Ricciae_BoGa-3]